MAQLTTSPDIGAFLAAADKAAAKAVLEITEGFSVHEFATDADKRLATGLVPGDIALVTGEGNRVEQYVGDVTVPIDALSVTHDSLTEIYEFKVLGTQGYYKLDNSRIIYQNDGNSKWTLATFPDFTEFVSSVEDYAGIDPYEATWPAGTSMVSTPLVNELNQGNWLVLRNTVYLYVDVPLTHFVNGVEGDDTVQARGWVDPLDITYSASSSFAFTSVLFYARDNYPDRFTTCSNSNYMVTGGVATVITLPTPAPSRGSVLVTI